MSWEVNDREFDSVLLLSASRRYEYLVKRSASHGELWGLHGDGGWVMAEDDDAKTHFPVWPHSRFAEACATGDRGEKPHLDQSPSMTGSRHGCPTSRKEDSESLCFRLRMIRASASRLKGSSATWTKSFRSLDPESRLRADRMGWHRGSCLSN